MICKNCGTEFEGNYCNQCGQKATVGRLTWKSVGNNLLHGIFHVDNTFVKTTRMLVVHPDRLISDYFEGRRKGYMAPIPLLAVWTSGSRPRLPIRMTLLTMFVRSKKKGPANARPVLI